MSNVKFNSTNRSVEDILNDKKNNRLTIPQHQRNSKVWNDTTRMKLIETVKNGHPMPSILIYKDSSDSIDDGLQRITSLEMFMNDEYPDIEGNHYSNWTPIMQYRFKSYPITVVEFRNATPEERIEIFDRFQNGSPLRAGERLHSLSQTTLVKFTIDTLRTPGKGLHDRFASVWGPIKNGAKDKRYNELLSYVSLINGAAHGFKDAAGGITKKYDDLRNNLLTPINETDTIRVLEKLLSIYDEVNMKRPVDGKKNLNVQKKSANFNGPIIYSLKECPNDWDILHKKWVDTIIEYRKDNTILDSKIHNGLSKARSWNNKRWKNACHNIFPDMRVFQKTSADNITEDDDDYSDSDESV